MIKNYFLALLYYMALLSAVYGFVSIGTFAYQQFETRGDIARVNFEGYTCFVGKGNMECFKDD